MADLVVPLAFWEGANTQIGAVTALHVHKKSLIVGGTSSGRLYLWSISYHSDTQKDNNKTDRPTSAQDSTPNEDERINMVCAMLGHNSAITSIKSALYEGEESIISVSSDGTICVWSFADGGCLNVAERVLKCKPTSMSVLPSNHQVAFAGNRTFIEIFSLKTMTISYTFAAHQHWINCLFTCDLSRANSGIMSQLLISGGSDGVVQFWSIPTEGECDTPLQTLCLDYNEPLSLTLDGSNRFLLVVFSEQWVVYTAKAGKEVLTIKCPDIGGWRSGSFINHYSLVVWSKEGNGYVYNLPTVPAVPLSFQANSSSSSIDKDRESRNSNSFEKNRQDDLVIQKHAPPSNFRSALLSKLNIIEPSSTDANTPSYVCTNTSSEEDSNIFIESIAATNGNLFATGTEMGRISVWITTGTDKLPPASRIAPWAVSRIAKKNEGRDEWTRPFAIHGLPPPKSHSKNLNIAPPNATASTIVEDHLLLVIGFEDGNMVVTALPTVDTTKLRYQTAHKGAVTSLLSLPMGSREVRVVSGGDDFEINVWSIKERSSFHLLYKFHNHFGPIVSLFTPEVPAAYRNLASSSRWKDYFFSISKDKTIALFSVPNNNCQHVYGVHSSFITNVKWQIVQDYLIVECDDGSVSIWEMSTGRLEATVHGETAREILECSDNLRMEPSGDSVDLLNKSVHAFTIQSQQDPSPIQLVFLNIRKLLNDFERSMKKSRRTLSISSSNSFNGEKNTPDNLETMGGVQSADITAAALSCTSFSVFSWFLPWGIESSLDELTKRELRLSPPNPEPSFALRGAGGRITVLVSRSTPSGSDRWCRSERLSALHTLSAASYTKQLMSFEPFQVSTSQLLTYYCALLADHIPNYSIPSLPFLAKFWRDPYDDVMQAARSIFISAADNMKVEAREGLIRSTASMIQQGREDDHRFVSVIVLAVLGSRYPDALQKGTGVTITNELVRLLNNEDRVGDNVALRIAASELIGKGFLIWKPYIRDVDAIVKQLFSMTMLVDPPYLATVSHQALMLIGVADPKMFINSLGAFITEASIDSMNRPSYNNNASHHSQAINCLGNLIRQDPVSLVALLPRLIEIIVKSLDPHIPYLRDNCVNATTGVLHILVKKYPMVSFHNDTQRLALGSREGGIVVYDLKTATKYYTLVGDHGVTALNFSPNGKCLASYSIAENLLRVWTTQTHFLSILHSNPTVQHRITIPETKQKHLSPLNLLDQVEVRWQGERTVQLIRQWESPTLAVLSYKI
ncbi:WD40 repeat-containing protein [Planoprotostelium fungivorum]|uniref:WD40 repeat-containing protein n=1 Tax=Planoprotostelium fungivorum TaxID=1890364 RepID=A0A2P6MQI7_9EUKA|nr:WD40 repeat-containing protein [Planoprotostelium fungivorum]